jgi:hypothetical protein
MIRRTFLVLLVLGLGACGGDSTGPASNLGRYTLQTVDGDPLPFVVLQVGADKIEITAAHINLNEDLTCSSSATLQVTTDGDVSTDVAAEVCTYTLNDTAISVVFPSDGGRTAVGSIVGSQLTLTDGGFVLIYSK